MQKNNAPPPKKGSIYLPEQEGMYFIICGISFDFPPLYLIIGFIFAIFPTKLQLFSHKTVNQAGIYPSGSIGRREWLFRSFPSGADIVFSRICFGSTMSRIRRLQSQRISLFIPKREGGIVCGVSPFGVCGCCKGGLRFGVRKAARVHGWNSCGLCVN